MQEKILSRIDSDRLQPFVVWIPVVNVDDREVAIRSTKLVTDHRAAQFWDPDKKLGIRYGEAVVLPLHQGKRHRLAWDVYFAFDEEREWGGRVPQPDDWMHQLGQDERRLDADKLRESILKLLKKDE